MPLWDKLVGGVTAEQPPAPRFLIFTTIEHHVGCFFATAGRKTADKR